MLLLHQLLQMSFQVTQAPLTGGSGYTSAPTVVFTGGGGTGATVTAVLANVVSSVNISAPGVNYTSAPTVAFSVGGGTGAAATSVITGGVVTTINVTNPGSGYTTVPTVAITGGIPHL